MNEATNITEKMNLQEFEQRLPEFFATGTGTISDDPRLQAFLLDNPDAAALVRDFEAIVAAAQSMFDVTDQEPSDAVWQNIQTGLQTVVGEDENPTGSVAANPVQ